MAYGDLNFTTAEIQERLAAVSDKIEDAASDGSLYGRKNKAWSKIVIPTVDVDKSYVDTGLGKKVDKVDGKSLISDTEIARLSKVDNYTLTKPKVEEVLTGDISTHNHAAQLAVALSNYVQKVVGKDLSTNDFTTVLKEKLEGLENYDDTAVQQAISTINGRIDTLIGTSASEAIDNFNEIEAFLQGITDKQTLTGLLNDLKQEIVALIPSTEGLASETWVGQQGFLKEIPSEYITELELEGKGFAAKSELTEILIRRW